MRLPNGLVYLPRKLKWLWWDNCPLKRLPSNFKAEYLVELRMVNSDLEKLWNGTQVLILYCFSCLFENRSVLFLLIYLLNNLNKSV